MTGGAAPSTVAEVVQVGLATAQDGGRTGFTSVGVPIAGALHRGRYLTATALLSGGEDPTVPAIEVLAGDLRLTVVSDTVIGVVGPCRVELAGRRAANGTLMHVAAGTSIGVSPVEHGPVYVVVGGWAPALTLGSCSIDTFSRLGGDPLAAGDRLEAVGPVPHVSAGDPRIGTFHRTPRDETGPLHVVEAGHRDLDRFCEQVWHVEAVARSGIRLRSPRWLVEGVSVPSMPVVPGAIQLTPSGEAIVLGPDGALTGGYPVVGVVATADLDRLALLHPGDQATFAEITLAAAVAAFDASGSRRRRLLAHPSTLA